MKYFTLKLFKNCNRYFLLWPSSKRNNIIYTLKVTSYYSFLYFFELSQVFVKNGAKKWKSLRNNEFHIGLGLLDLVDNTGWFISNGTVQNTDLSADGHVLIKKCIASKLRNYRKCSRKIFDNLFIFHNQYWCLLRQGQRAKYTHLRLSLMHNIA